MVKNYAKINKSKKIVVVLTVVLTDLKKTNIIKIKYKLFIIFNKLLDFAVNFSQ